MYFYPMYVNDQLIDHLADSDKILPYIDMPLQHANDRMLRRMQRRVNRNDTEQLLTKLRQRIPSLVLRTTFITGFPGETAAEFTELTEFVREQAFEHVGVFTYSLEPDTPSARLPDHLPEQVKQERRSQLMEVQQEVAFAWNDRQIGRKLDILVDSQVPGEKNAWIGRSYAHAPDVDGIVYLSGSGIKVGDLVPAEIAVSYTHLTLPTKA